MEILKTKDYSIFKLLPSNREIVPAHVEYLRGLIRVKNLLDVNPMLVRPDMGIIEGQHRLKAAELEGEFIYYQIKDGLTNADMAMLNTSRKNWKLIDYLDSWVNESSDEYKKVAKFINLNPKIPLTTALTLLSTQPKPLPTFKTGNFVVNSLEFAIDIAGDLRKLSEYDDKFIYTAAFISAYRQVKQVEGFDGERLHSKISHQPRSFVVCINSAQYLEMIEEIYNFKSRDDTRLQLRIGKKKII